MPPIDPVRWQPPPVVGLPPCPPAPVTLVPVPGRGPEDVVVDAEGNLWVGLVGGELVRLRPDGSRPEVIVNTGGRPLGLTVARDGRILVCDSPRGLLAVDPATGRIHTLVDRIAGRPLQFCSNVTELADGTIYFTESTSALTVADYVGAILEARGRGALHRLDIDGTVTTVVDGLYFANGVTPTLDGAALVVAETQARRLSKYWLRGTAAGSLTPLVENLPAMPDNLSTAPDGSIWCAMAAPVNKLVDWLATKPPVLRKLAWGLPEWLRPGPAPILWAAAFEADTGVQVGGVHTRHRSLRTVTGMVESGGRVWLGSLTGSDLGWVDAAAVRTKQV